MQKSHVFLVGLFFSASLMAQEMDLSSVLCERDRSACEALAVEVIRLDLIEQISQRGSERNQESIVCAEDAGEACSRFELSLLGEAQLMAKIPDQNHCPMPGLHPDLCDVINTTCDRGEIYLPWSGCAPRLVIDIPPTPWPPYCPDGTEWNGKICRPVPCYTQTMGIRIPCPVFGEHLTHLSTAIRSEGGYEGSAFINQLNQSDIRERAIDALSAELRAALGELESIREGN